MRAVPSRPRLDRPRRLQLFPASASSSAFCVVSNSNSIVHLICLLEGTEGRDAHPSFRRHLRIDREISERRRNLTGINTISPRSVDSERNFIHNIVTHADLESDA